MKSDLHKFLDEECSKICGFCCHSEPRSVEGEEDNGYQEPYCNILKKIVDPYDFCVLHESNGNKWEKL